jgi:hypothetical protein
MNSNRRRHRRSSSSYRSNPSTSRRVSPSPRRHPSTSRRRARSRRRHPDTHRESSPVRREDYPSRKIYLRRVTASPTPRKASLFGGLLFGPSKKIDNRFKYTPLDQSIDSIRLIHLQPYAKPGTGEEQTIQCRLKHVTFANKPKYDALSYTWGDPTNLKTIRVDGKSLQIQKNLWTALDHLRREAKTQLVLWADALCINQADIEERSRQVGQMAFIYSRAQKVHVWLGEAKESFRGPERLYQIRAWNNEFVSQQELKWLCNRDYWQRLWIIQEIGLATNLSVVYADKTQLFRCRWREFVNVLRENQRFLQETEPHEILPPLKLAQQRDGRHGDINRLERLIETFKLAKCTEPRDKIYGLLGLANDCSSESLTVDYSKTLFQLFEEVVMFQYHARPRKDGFPPSIDRSMRLVHFGELVQRQIGMARSTTRRRSMTRSSNSTMCARGLIVGTVLHVGPSYSEYISMCKASQTWKLSFEKHYPAARRLQRIRELDDLYEPKLLEWDCESVNKYCGSGSEISWGERCDEPWLTGLRRAQDDQSMPTPNPNVSSSNELSSQAGPQLFLADNYMMGLAPSGTQEGDVICRFWLTQAAAVMRPEGESGRFKVIGRANIETFSRWEDESPYYQESPSTTSGVTVNVHMDIDTLQILTC